MISNYSMLGFYNGFDKVYIFLTKDSLSLTNSSNLKTNCPEQVTRD